MFFCGRVCFVLFPLLWFCFDTRVENKQKKGVWITEEEQKKKKKNGLSFLSLSSLSRSLSLFLE